MKTILVVVLLFAIAFSANIRDRVQYEYAFENYLRENSKSYSTSEEYIYRLQVFADNLDKIEIHNAAPSSYKLGINKFSDMTSQEFENSRFCGGLSLNKKIGQKVGQHISKLSSIPSEIDWTTEGVVSKVKDQAACGSCWAFSATGSLESAYYMKNKEMKLFSEQQLVDCSSSYGNMGCNGGLMTSAFDYIKDSGLCLESDYPYRAVDQKCKNTCKPAVQISGYIELDQNEKALAEALAERPISVALNASPIQSYSKGIFDGPCSDALNHGVLAVGYGEQSGVKFWKLKNSWGGNWGEKGYFRIIKDIKQVGGQCGIAEMNCYPTL